MGYVDNIENIFQAMPVNTSIIICDASLEMSYLLDLLEARNFPCMTLSTTSREEMERYPNKVIMSTSYEINHDASWDILSKMPIDCVFFIGQDTFKKCITTCTTRPFEKKPFFFIF